MGGEGAGGRTRMLVVTYVSEITSTLTLVSLEQCCFIVQIASLLMKTKMC